MEEGYFISVVCLCSKVKRKLMVEFIYINIYKISGEDLFFLHYLNYLVGLVTI